MEKIPENVRPWGRYDILEAGPGYKVKRIEVKPGHRLSYQSHQRRSEVWTVVAGKGQMTLDDKNWELDPHETVTIPIGGKHRMTNIGEKENVVFIEVQVGDYLGEDDITRYDDDYGREGKTTPHGE